MKPSDTETIHQTQGSPVTATRRLTGGCISKVYAVTLADGRQLVAKVGKGSEDLSVESEMLRFLTDHSALPSPTVLYAAPHLLLMTLLPGTTGLTPAGERDAARHIAALHSLSAPHFGFERDTVIALLPQPNPKSAKWVPFFRDHRLLHMARLAEAAGRLDGRLLSRLERLAARLDNFLIEPERPSLLHGDLWSGNILSSGDKITGFIDPAVYFGHAEVELAYTTLFSTFGDAFFSAYERYRPLQPGFFEERRDLYVLYPLLVHVRLFGGTYVASVDAILKRFGL